MKIMALGKNSAGNLLFKPTDEDIVARALAAALERNQAGLRGVPEPSGGERGFAPEMARPVIDAGDPRSVGWTFLVAAGDPQRDEIIAILEPLAEHRGMADPTSPLVFNGEPEDEWGTWLQDNYYALELEGKKVPKYVLMIGGPELLPFKLQSLIVAAANVGRVAFDTVDDLRQYVKKLLRLETATGPAVQRQALLFATDGGNEDPTYFSREYMVKPLAQRIQHELKFGTTALMGNDATKKKLGEALRETKPALVYTASHGLGMTGKPLDEQKQYNGALCCQTSGPITLDALYCADDVPLTEPFLEGAVFFQFACYGYGTPAQSDYTHWLDNAPETLAETDFVAALPKRLLAHPRGPIAYIGHVDTAFLHGFTDQDAPVLLERWHARIQPFLHAVNQLLTVQPPGLAMQDMNDKYALCSTLLANYYDRQKSGKLKVTPETTKRLVDSWIIRNDAQNYMVFGDPAASLRIPDA